MATTIPIIAESAIQLKPAYIYEFIGSGTLYSYQVLGEGSLTLEVSNNRKDWITLFTADSSGTVVLKHSWLYQRLTSDGLKLIVSKK